MLDYITVWDADCTDDWQLTGTNRSNTDNGRLYLDVSIVGGNTTITLFKDSDMTTAVAAGTLTGNMSGALALAQQNGSGISGSLTVKSAQPVVESFLDVFYADDDDVTSRHPDVSDLLTNGQFNGQPGFAEPLARAKRTIDNILDSCCTEDTEALTDLQQLADVCALYALYFIFQSFATDDKSPANQLAKRFRRDARHTFFETKVQTPTRVFHPLSAFVVRG